VGGLLVEQAEAISDGHQGAAAFVGSSFQTVRHSRRRMLRC
jgi:hypothetical protein